VASDGAYTLYPWAKDAAGNVSAAFATPPTVNVDTAAPTVTAFTATSPSTSLNIPITSFTATDSVGVTGYLITESATPPLPTNPGWQGSAPATYTVASDGSYTLYPWAKDAAGNVSAVYATPATVDVDTAAPTVTAFSATSPSTSLDIPITSFTATDNAAVTGYMITTSPVQPLAGDAGWQGSAPATYTVASDGSYTLYPWAKDAAGNVSAAFATPPTVVVDTAAPTVTAFTATSPSTSLDIPITSFTATDSVGVTGYLITESATPPLPTNPGWQGSAPATYTVASDGSYTLYPWAKDAAGNVSAVFATPPSVQVDTGSPTVTAFTATSPSTSLDIPITSFTATDSVGVTGYLITESATPPLPTNPGWQGSAPATYTVASDGSYTLYPWAKDAADNVSAVFATPPTVVVDTTAPIVSSTIPADLDTGVGVDSPVTIIWSENVACATVTPASVTILPPVTWTRTSCSGNQAVFSPSGQSGLITYTVTVSTSVTDTGGNPMSLDYQFSYTTESSDITPPSSSVTDPGDGTYINSDDLDPYLINGSASDNSEVDSIEVSINGGPWSPATCAGCPGADVTWTYSWALPADGSYTIQSRATDAAENPEIPGAGSTITIDRTAPAIIWNVPANGSPYKDGDSIIIDADVTETGLGIADGANCNPRIDGFQAGFTGSVTYSTATQNCTGTLTLNSPSNLTDGAHDLTLEVIDLANNSAPGPIRIINIDNTAASSSVTDPSDGATLNNSSPDPYTITGVASDNAGVSSVEVSTDGGNNWSPANCTGCGNINASWTYSWTLPLDGSYIVMSRATDSSGNVESPAVFNTITVERAAPVVTTTIPLDSATGVTPNSPITIFWNENVNCSTVNASSVTINPGSLAISSCTANEAVFTTSGQSNSISYTVTVTSAVEDPAGNAMTAPYGFSYTTGGSDVPSLSYDTAPFNDGIDPDSGDTTTEFTYKIIYTDSQNDAPSAGYPKIYIGDHDGYFSYVMTEDDIFDTDYTDGKTYNFTTGLGAAADQRFYFEAQAATGDSTVVNFPSGASAYNSGPFVYLMAGYNLVGTPKDISSGSWFYDEVLGDDTGFMYCLRWESLGPDSMGTVNGDWADNTDGFVNTGSGYFVWSTGAFQLDEPLVMANDTRPFVDVDLDPDGGWSVITNPYNAIIALQDVSVIRGGTEYTFQDAVINGWVLNSIYAWEGDGPGYAYKAFNGNPPAILAPWMGYFIYASDSTPMTLRIYRPTP
jgi:hypothetical protein